MSENKNNEFDQNVIDRLSKIMPPEEEVKSTNPWSKPITLITWGFVLTLFQVNFFFLQYILPAFGVILIFQGFRSLRNENAWFKVTWILSMIQLVLYLFGLLFITTPLIKSNYSFEIATFSVIYQISFLLIFRKALRIVFQQSGQKQKQDPLLATSILTGVAFIIAWSPYNHNWFIVILISICYILSYICLFHIGKTIDDTGYRLYNSPVKLNNSVISALYISFTIIFVVVSCIYFNHVKLEGAKYTQPNMNGTREILIKKGFPKEILQYLGDKSVAPIVDSINIKSSTINLHIGDNGIFKLPDVLEARTVYIEMPKSEMYVLQYFKWTNAKAYWKDGIQIFTDETASDVQIITSGLMYDKNGITYHADFPSLDCKFLPRNTFFGKKNCYQIYDGISYPFGSDKQQGYVLYRYKIPQCCRYTNSSLNYIHNMNPFMIPYFNIEDNMISGVYENSDNTRPNFTYYNPGYGAIQP